MAFTLPGFAAFIAAQVAETDAAMRKGLEAGAKIIETEAKAEIGHYQGAAGPFAAWAPLADATKADRARKGYAPDEPLLRTGEMRDSIGHTVISSHQAQVGSNNDKAVWQELGTPKIPPRSFLGGAAVRKEAEVAKAVAGPAVALLAGNSVVAKMA